MKDLLVPFSEQNLDMIEGLSYFVYVYLDEESERIVASAKTNKFLDNVPPEYEEGEEVDLIIGNRSDLGMKVVINQMHTGLLYHNEIFQVLKPGEKLKGYIKQVREDDRIDVMLQETGYDRVEGIAGDILRKLEKSQGFVEVNDKSSPETIKHIFGVSKKAFKKAVGALYKDRLITFDGEGIRLVK